MTSTGRAIVPDAACRKRNAAHGKFSVADGRRAVCNRKSTMIIVNSGMVSAAARNFFLPHFCVFFRDSGRNLHSRNPVNYLFVTAVRLTEP
jgi:hypothetical protein